MLDREKLGKWIFNRYDYSTRTWAGMGPEPREAWCKDADALLAAFPGLTPAHPGTTGPDADAVKLAQLSDALAECVAARDKAVRSQKFTEQWYAQRLEPIKDVAKRVGVWDEVAAIIANGSGTRPVDGKWVYEPPTYAQQLNMAIHRAEAAEAEVLRLSAPTIPKDMDK